MSSVQGFCDCQRCGEKGSYIFNCRSREEWFQCHYCGYFREIRDLIDRKRSNNKNQYCKLNKKGEVIQRLFIRKAYGAYLIQNKKGGAQFGGLGHPLDEKAIASFRKVLERPDIDAESSYLTRWDEESKEVIFLIGNSEIASRIHSYDRGTSDAEPIKNPEVHDEIEDELPF